MLVAALNAAYAVARPVLFRVDAESAHEFTLALLAMARLGPPGIAVARRLVGADDPALVVEAFGLRFPNVVGLASGMDKNAVALPAWAALGFGHVEVGTVTPHGQPGNPRPRVFRLPTERALINRMGFPNRGANAAAARLARRPAGSMIVGGNVGKGRDTSLEQAPVDYEQAARALYPYVDYLAVNVSSPNTPGLRMLQAPDQVRAILGRVRPLGDKPVLVKIAPDLDPAALGDIVAAASDGGAAGLIATNTTTSRDGLARHSSAAGETGGLSGAPLRVRALALTRRLAELAGPDLPVIGAGGIGSAADVQERLEAGARLVQVYSALVFEGPGLIGNLLRARRSV